MDHTNRHFKGQQRNEELVYYTRAHWITLMPLFLETVLLVGITTGLISLSFVIGETGTMWEVIFVLATAGITGWLNTIFIRFLNYFLGIVLVTNFRVIRLEKTLYLRDDKNVVDLHEIQDIKKFQHGIVSNLLNYGRLVIVVPTMIEPMILNSIPNPDKFFQKVNNAKRDYIHNRQQQRLEVFSRQNSIIPEHIQNALSGTT